MFNSFLFNTGLFNGLATAIPEAATEDIQFNDFVLSNGNSMIIQTLKEDSGPRRAFDFTEVPRGHGNISYADYFREKHITMRGTLRADSAEDLEDAIDEMKKELSVREGNLDIVKNGVVRRYVATLTNMDSIFQNREGYHITFCPFFLDFTCLEPFGKSVNYESTAFLDETDLAFDEELFNEGTAPTQPVVIFNFSAASSLTEVSFLNNTTGEEIVYTGTISAGDYLRFDSEEKEVTLNGTSVDYSGSFPSLAVEENSYTITVTGTSATYTLTIKYKTKYL